MNPRTQVRLASERRRAERRRARRVAPGQLTPCVIRPAGSDEEGLPGWVHNVSVRGAGLLSSRSFAPGDLLHVLFINAAHTFALSVEVRVVRGYRVVNGDYFLGAQFTQPLRYDELLPFIV